MSHKCYTSLPCCLGWCFRKSMLLWSFFFCSLFKLVERVVCVCARAGVRVCEANRWVWRERLSEVFSHQPNTKSIFLFLDDQENRWRRANHIWGFQEPAWLRSPHLSSALLGTVTCCPTTCYPNLSCGSDIAMVTAKIGYVWDKRLRLMFQILFLWKAPLPWISC